MIPAPSIVETKDKNSYHIEADPGLMIGGVYRIWQSGGQLIHLCAVITCPPHDRFSEHHDKSIPLFLPIDADMVRLWLGPTFHEADFLRSIIEQARITAVFSVTPIKNSRGRDLAPLGPAALMERDTS